MMSPDLNLAAALTQAVEWMYDHMFAGDPPGRLMTEAEIDGAVHRACAAAGVSGFVTGIGGVLTLPVSIPANILSVVAVHLALVKRIAAGRGYDLSDEKVRGLVTACLLGNTTLEMLKEAGVRYGVQGSQAMLSRAAVANVGGRLAAKTGAGGAANLAKALPFVGGLIGGAIDALATRAVAGVARRVFERQGTPAPAGPIIDGELVS